MAPTKRKRSGFVQKIFDFDPISLFQRPPPPRTPRTVFVQKELPIEYYKVKKNGKKTILKDHSYATNQVVTSKYTVITFVPRNLLEQFRRVANIFFLAINILQFFPKFSTISPGLVILPLLAIVVLTGLKDGYEDVKRHQSDRAVNHSVVETVDGGGFFNPNVTGAKSKTFTPGIRRVFKKKSKSGKPDTSAQTAIDEAESRDAAGEHQIDLEHAMRVDLPAPVNPETITSPHKTKDPTSPLHASSPHPKPKPNGAHWRPTLWEDVRVGDFVRLRCDDAVPADMVICATSDPENVAFIETKNLDGETNLKSRSAVPELVELDSPEAILERTRPGASHHFAIDAEAPDVNMYRLNAAVVMHDGEQHPIDLQTVLLRGTVIRNTDWVIGVVMYTGLDTKIVMNSGITPSKRSKVERQMNPMVLINLAVICAMAVVCGIVDSIHEHHFEPLGALWLYLGNRSGDNPSINGLVTFANAFITFQNIIPISLYISIEFVRTAQAAFIYFDSDMVYVKKGESPEEGRATLARSWNLADDLGQIEYIFSDKTGTLTQNSMEFRQCSIGGRLYEGDGIEIPKEKRESASPTEPIGSSDSDASDTKDIQATKGFIPSTATVSNVHFPTVQLSDGVLSHFQDPEIIADIRNEDGSRGDQQRAIDQFFTCLALCHTVLASVDEDEGISFKAQSPDEAALVQAAADVGYIFLGKEPGTQTLKLQTPHAAEPQTWELLNLLDFTSARKRMSVILRRHSDDKIIMLTKGADNVIYERLAASVSQELRTKTEQDLETFANEGLRTLCLGSRVLDEDEYNSWNREYHEALVQLENRDEHIETASSKIEQDLTLLGATAIEDKLQDGVPETIADLKRAGIKVWVATGDKLETAIAIGYSTNLIQKQSNLIIVRGGGSVSVYSQMVKAIENYFPTSGVLDIADVLPEGERPEMGRFESRRRSLQLRRANTGISDIVGKDNGSRAGGFVLVIDGPALTSAFAEDYSQQLLLQLSTRCEAVVCCRVSPLQKALVVRLVKDNLNVMTLAIGDGANDVSMIQAADVGIGISGEEGLQAVNASDYAIGQFRFLKRLLFVHGEWTYARNSNMIVNFFYKNVMGVGVLWWFQIYCGWSTTYVFEYTYLLFWNVFWSLAPVIAIGIFDRNIDSHILMDLPELYRYGRQRKWFGYGPFFLYILEGIVQSAVVFFLLFYAYQTTSSRTDGYDVYMFEFSTTMVMASVLVVNAFHGISTSAWTGWIWFAVSIGVILIWLYTLAYSAFPPSLLSTPVYGNDSFLFPSAYFWFGMFLTFFLAMLPRYLAKAYRINYMPNDIDILRIFHKVHPEVDLLHHELAGGRFTNDGALKPLDEEALQRYYAQKETPEEGFALRRRSTKKSKRSKQLMMHQAGSRTDMSTGQPLAPNRGFDFSQEEGGHFVRRIQTNLSERNANTPLGPSGSKRKRSRLIHNIAGSLRRSGNRKPTSES